MPAIITHDLFGRDFHQRAPQLVGSGKDERLAFLLGNQGPDPLFYAVADFRIRQWAHAGTVMHQQNSAALLAALPHAVAALPPTDRAVGRAWAHGFMCHYALDSTMHPLVHAIVYALCDAGVQGFSRQDASMVHGVVESDLDEMALSVKKGVTVREFKPYERILRGDAVLLDACSSLFSTLARRAFGYAMPRGTYADAVRAFRRVQRFLYAPGETKRRLVKRAEQRLTHGYSRYDAMAHRAILHERSDFDNEEHVPWINPFTGAQSDASFWDLYRRALGRAEEAVRAMDKPGFDVEAALGLTGGINFSGRIAD
ncbi:zinc dependent phospholipase C family protein [Curtanaerobium respiraculi]|uniref:zinc dependent phospholipase C family protein n=1 Tax=Curtanaerobium respiraculi TaxID=2949669 RepID=UPI0024B33A10|nr:zinc dependent phospholipase C family protein [Curtanaerobium respiraculi]